MQPKRKRRLSVRFPVQPEIKDASFSIAMKHEDDSDDEGDSDDDDKINFRAERWDIHWLTNRFYLSRKIENHYRKNRFVENHSIFIGTTIALIVCFSMDCGFLSVLLWRVRDKGRFILCISLASICVFGMLVTLFLYILCQEFLCRNYQNVLTFVALSGFSYFIFTDNMSMCEIFNAYDREESLICFQNLLEDQDDGRRVAYGMSLMFGALPFCFRLNFFRCLITYSLAIVLHMSMRLIAVLNNVEELSLQTTVSDFLFLSTIMFVMLRGAYIFERQDRQYYLRFGEQYLKAHKLGREIQDIENNLELAKEEQNTAETRLAINEAKSELDKLYEGATEYLKGWIIDFGMLKFEEKIGRGSFGEVYKGRYSYDDAEEYNMYCTDSFQEDVPHHRRGGSLAVGGIVAIKNIPQSKLNKESALGLLKETYILSKCRHPNVLQLVALVWDPYVCLVFEYMQANLKDLLYATASSDPQRLTELEENFMGSAEAEDKMWNHVKTRMCIDIAYGVSYLHANDIMHRDLKSSNLLIGSTLNVKVADFGSARWSKYRRPLSNVGTPYWSAPETVNCQSDYDEKCDVWSFGVILGELLTHSDPYTDRKGGKHFTIPKLGAGEINPVDYASTFADEYKIENLKMTKGIIELMKSCCKFNPNERCTMKEAKLKLFEIMVSLEEIEVKLKEGSFSNVDMRRSVEIESVGQGSFKRSRQTVVSKKLLRRCSSSCAMNYSSTGSAQSIKSSSRKLRQCSSTIQLFSSTESIEEKIDDKKYHFQSSKNRSFCPPVV